MDEVFLIASGYDWQSPKCDTWNKEDVYKKQATCSKCDTTFNAAPPDHAYE